MLNLVILEDNRIHCAQLKALLADYPGSEKFCISEVSSGRDLRNSLMQNMPDVLFADIILEGEEMNGISLIKELCDRSDTQVIYVTGYIDYCTRVYDTEHISFLVKPIDRNELYAAIDRAIKNISDLRERRAAQTVIISYGGQTIPFSPGDVVYIESNRRKLTIHLKDRVIETYMSLDDIEKRLGYGFVRCHQSFAVNMRRICACSGDTLLIENGVRIPVSQKRKAETKEKYLEFIASQA